MKNGDETNPKGEAVFNITKVMERLADEKPISAFERKMLRAQLEYARDEVDKIQELKRPRKAAAEPAAAAPEA
jgi:hypothetical protein